MEKKERPEYYDKLLKGEWREQDTGPSAQTRYRLISRLIRKDLKEKEKSLIDVGSSAGGFLVYINERFSYPKSKINACDFSEESIRIIRSKGFDNVFRLDLTQKDMKESRKFDMVICSEVLEHIKDYKAAIKNISRMMKPGAEVVITVPNNPKFWTRRDTIFGHLRRFKIEQLRKDMEKEGIRVIKHFTWGGLVYRMFWFFLDRMPPSINPKNTSGGRIISRVLLLLFYIDDLFIRLLEGRTLYVLGVKD